MNGFHALVDKIEAAIDAHPQLTRKRSSGFADEAKLVFTNRGWSASITVRHRQAKGRGARTPMEISHHEAQATPEAAVRALLDSLPSWTEALK